MLQTLDTSRSNEIDIERNSTGRTRSLCSNYELINCTPYLDITGQIRGVLCEILEKIYRDISGVHCIYRMVFHSLCELSLWLLLWVNKRYLKFEWHHPVHKCDTGSPSGKETWEKTYQSFHSVPLGAGTNDESVYIQPLHFFFPWASCQIRKIAGCACAGNAGNVFPASAGSRSRHASSHVRPAHAQPAILRIWQEVHWKIESRKAQPNFLFPIPKFIYKHEK